MRTIYLITNTVNGLQYVGETGRDLDVRWRHHCWPSTPTLVSAAVQEYGVDVFTIEALEACDDEFALERELYWVKKFDTFVPNGYNQRAGRRNSPELTKRIGESNRGKTISDETRARLSASHMGQVKSPETRQKLSETNKGKPLPISARENSLKATVKTFTMLSPQGEEVTFTNMAKFCREHGLSNTKLCMVAAGKAKHHKGWKIPQQELDV